MITVDGDGRSAASEAIVPSVPITTRSFGSDALDTTAAGSSNERPAEDEVVGDVRRARRRPMKITSVPGVAASRVVVEVAAVAGVPVRTVTWAASAAVGERDAGERRHGGQRRHARHDLVRDAGIDERLDLLAAAAEDERVAALQPHDARGRGCRGGRAARSPPPASAPRAAIRAAPAPSTTSSGETSRS